MTTSSHHVAESSSATAFGPATAEILAARGVRNVVDPWKPYAFHVEPEHSRFGIVEDVATIFLTNRECPFRCTFCDLWKNTTIETAPLGAIPAQIDFAVRQLPATRHIKLYNSGNFFDPRAIPVADRPAIADRVRHFSTVIVENHPNLCGDDCGRFQQQIRTQLEVALGLETSHELTLSRLNKQMTCSDFIRACETLRRDQILIRVFILLKPADTTEEQGVERALDSIRFAFSHGASCCSVIPVRPGNGFLDQLAASGRFSPPKLSSLEFVVREAQSWQQGRVFGDIWDARQFADVPSTADAQLETLRLLNMNQAGTVLQQPS